MLQRTFSSYSSASLRRSETNLAVTTSSYRYPGAAGPRRARSASASPYPRSWEDISHARNANRRTQRSRAAREELPSWASIAGQGLQRASFAELEAENKSQLTSTLDDDLHSIASCDSAASHPAFSDDEDMFSDYSDEDDFESLTDEAHGVTTRAYIAEKEPYQTLFPTTLPSLEDLLSTQVGFEPERRAPESKLEWDTMETAVPEFSPEPRGRKLGFAPSTVFENIIKEAMRAFATRSQYAV